MTNEELVQYMVVGIIVALTIGVMAFAVISFSNPSGAEERQRQQKQDFIECLGRIGIGADGQGWCYDKFIK